MERAPKSPESKQLNEQRNESGPEKQGLSHGEQESLRSKHIEKLDKAREKLGSIPHETQPVIESSPSKESHLDTTSAASSFARSKKETYVHTLRSTRNDLSPVDRTLSKVIHAKVLEKPIEVAANTVFRPVPLASAGLFAFAGTAGIFVLGKYYGIALEGSTWFILAASVGYAVGMVVDFIKLTLIKRSN